MNVIFWSSDHPESTPSFYRSIGPYKISHWISKHGYTSQVIDFIVHFTEEELYQVTKKFIDHETLVLGISTTFMCNHKYVRSDQSISNFPLHVENVAKRLKEEFNIKIVLGGYGSEHVYMDGIADATVMSFTSSTEDVMVEYLNYLRGKSNKPIGKLITNFAYNRNTKTKTRIWYDSAKTNNYNIEHDDFKWRKNDCILPGESLPLDVSKGCIFACRFCNYPHLGKKKLDYIRGMHYLEEEIVYNYENFKTVHYMILDDTFNDTVYKLNTFKSITDKLNFKISYTAYLRADLIHRFPESIDILRETGLVGAVHGLESLHPHASNILGKAWSGKYAREFIPKLYHDYWNKKIGQQLNFIIGLPKETKEDILGTVKWAKENDLFSLHFSPLGLHSTKLQSKDHYLHTIVSEFGKNPEKYGFHFDSNHNWYNETWTASEAFAFHKEVLSEIRLTSLRKLNAWQFGNVQALGYDYDYILNTPLAKYNFSDLKTKMNDFYKRYYSMLMGL